MKKLIIAIYILLACLVTYVYINFDLQIFLFTSLVAAVSMLILQRIVD